MRLRYARLLYHPTLEMQDLLAMAHPLKFAAFGSAVVSAENCIPMWNLKMCQLYQLLTVCHTTQHRYQCMSLFCSGTHEIIVDGPVPGGPVSYRVGAHVCNARTRFAQEQIDHDIVIGKYGAQGADGAIKSPVNHKCENGAPSAAQHAERTAKCKIAMRVCMQAMKKAAAPTRRRAHCTPVPASHYLGVSACPPSTRCRRAG